MIEFGIGPIAEIRILRIRYLPWTLAVGNCSYSYAQAGYGDRDRARSAVALLPRTVGRCWSCWNLSTGPVNRLYIQCLPANRPSLTRRTQHAQVLSYAAPTSCYCCIRFTRFETQTPRGNITLASMKSVLVGSPTSHHRCLLESQRCSPSHSHSRFQCKVTSGGLFCNPSIHPTPPKRQNSGRTTKNSPRQRWPTTIAIQNPRSARRRAKDEGGKKGRRLGQWCTVVHTCSLLAACAQSACIREAIDNAESNRRPDFLPLQFPAARPMGRTSGLSGHGAASPRSFSWLKTGVSRYSHVQVNKQRVCASM